MGVIEQEKAKGHNIMHLGGDLYLEVSEFKGKTYGAIRRWFKADDGAWYRTKNGLHMLAVELRDFLAFLHDTTDADVFLADEIANPWKE